MKNIFLINGGKVFGSSKAQLNSTLHETAKKTLLSLGKEVRECEIDKGYVPSEQVENFLWADAVIWQMPAWWMGEPWIVKKYIDEVFTEGGGRFLTSDGRHRVDPAHGYGTGGLLKDKSYMFSGTWNAPIEAFTEKGEFFEFVNTNYSVKILNLIQSLLKVNPNERLNINDIILECHIINIKRNCDSNKK